MKVLCYIIGHRWSNWKYVKTIGRYDEMIDRSCVRCAKRIIYTGPTKINEFGYREPDKY